MKQHKCYKHIQACNLCKENTSDVYRHGKEDALHFKNPMGIKVFIENGDIEKYDEYFEGDPYGVGIKLKSLFYKRRETATLFLLDIALGKIRGEGKRILDIGCGEGYITAAIKKAFPGCEIFALDQSISAIKKAVMSFKDIDFIVADAYLTPYERECFDIVVCNNLWEHVPDPLRLLVEISRITKPGGFLIISTPSRYRFSNLLRVLLGKPLEFMSKNHITEYSVGQVAEQLRYGGYQVEKIYTEPINSESKKMFKRIFHKLLITFVRLMGKLINRPHDIESTIFFLARRIDNGKY